MLNSGIFEFYSDTFEFCLSVTNFWTYKQWRLYVSYVFLFVTIRTLYLSIVHESFVFESYKSDLLAICWSAAKLIFNFFLLLTMDLFNFLGLKVKSTNQRLQFKDMWVEGIRRHLKQQLIEHKWIEDEQSLGKHKKVSGDIYNWFRNLTAFCCFTVCIFHFLSIVAFLKKSISFVAFLKNAIVHWVFSEFSKHFGFFENDQ